MLNKPTSLTHRLLQCVCVMIAFVLFHLLVGAEAEDSGEQPPEESWRQWERPDVTLFLTGEQHGYIEPCGCTGLENQKGGLARRHTLLKELQEQGWDVLPLDVGNQVRRYGQQAGIKFQTTINSLRKLHYRAIGFGPDDLKLDVGLLLSEAVADDDVEAKFVSANVTLLDPELLPRFTTIDTPVGKIGVTSALDPELLGRGLGDEISVAEMIPALKDVMPSLDGCSKRVLLLYGGNNAEESVKEIVEQVEGFDLIVVANEFGEPYYQPKQVGKTQVVLTGHKGMYACLVGFSKDDPKVQYARVPLSHHFKDSSEMLQSLESYQQHLKNLGFAGLDLKPIPHQSNDKFVGSEKCGECHTSAMEVWESTPHAHATESLVHPPNDRGSIERHFDPECLSCHTTGWNPQNFYPYTTGYLGLKETPQLVGNGCENCHGPGSRHVAAEEEGELSEEELVTLRKRMVLPLAKAKSVCMECHDLDNSPDFHKPGAFEEYWEEVKHYGKD